MKYIMNLIKFKKNNIFCEKEYDRIYSYYIYLCMPIKYCFEIQRERHIKNIKLLKYLKCIATIEEYF